MGHNVIQSTVSFSKLNVLLPDGQEKKNLRIITIINTVFQVPTVGFVGTGTLL